MQNVLHRIRGGLIVSVQAPAGSVLDTPHAIALLARCAELNGAVGVRIEGIEKIAEVAKTVDIPVIGIVKRRSEGSDVFITPAIADVEAIIAAGAAIVAFDATSRARATGVSREEILKAIQSRGVLAMADCANVNDLPDVCDIFATTLAGYTADTSETDLPDLAMVRALAHRSRFVMCEGGVSSPEDVERAFQSGADAVVVGTALTGLDRRIQDFVASTPQRNRAPSNR